MTPSHQTREGRGPHRRRAARLLCVIALALAAALLAACGSDPAPKATPGSPEHPLVAQPTTVPLGAGRSNEASHATGRAAPGAAVKPGYQKLVEQQPSKPRSRFTPCNLVTQAQARAIVGEPILEPLEATQGPTCVYRSRSGKSFVTVAVQSLAFEKLQPRIRHRHRVTVSDRTAYCGSFGQPMLYVPLSRGRVLSIAAPCAVAKRFAATAVRQL
jgi:hypothetical protein